MKKRYLLICILFLAGCNNKNPQNENNSSQEESFSSASETESQESISSESESISESSIEEEEETFNGYGYFNCLYGEEDYSRRVRFNFELSDLIYLDNDKYNRNLSRLGILLSAEMDGMYTFLDDCNDKRPYLFNQLGLDDFKQYNLSDNEYQYDQNDVCSFELAHKKLSILDGDYEVIMVSIAGTNDNNDEWLSNLDIGVNNDTYYSYTGEHPEWENKDNHKGFDVTANRVESIIEEYVDENLDEGSKKAIFITGHSRGGSIANLLGKKYEEKQDYKSFAYCFAPARTTTSGLYNQYSTIFNIINEDDVVCALPPASLGFKLYGREIRKSVYEDYLENMNSTISFEYVSGNAKKFEDRLSKFVTSREAMYEIDYSDSYNQSFLSESKAISSYNETKIRYEKLNVSDFVEITYPTKTKLGLCSYSVYFAPQYVMELIKNMLVNGVSESALEENVDILSINFYKNLLTLGINNFESRGIQDSHMPASYYVIADLYHE